MNRETISLDSISWKGIARELLRNLWMILMFAMSVWFGATGLGKLIYTPEYTVSATVVVGVKGNTDTYSSLSTASRMADVIGEIFQSDVMRELIEDETGTSAQVSISSSQIPETNLLVIDAKASAPADAYRFLSAALKHYDEVSQYVFANATLQVLQEPSVPTQASNRPRFSGHKNEMALLGALLMACVIVAFYCLRYTLKSSRSAEKELDGTVIGTIPFERRRVMGKKKKEALLISSPVVSMRYAETSRKTAARIEHYLHRNGYQVLLIVSVGENEGKSTVAANAAIALAEKYKKVLLVDGDFRKPAQYKIFDRKRTKENPVEALLSGKADLTETVRYNQKSGIYELFLNHAVSQPENLLQPENIRRLIESLKGEMDYIIIDCSPTAACTDAEVWMQAADTVVLVVRQDWSDIRAINDTVDMIWQSGCNFSGFVLNAFLEDGDHKTYDYSGYRSSDLSGNER